MTAMPTGLWDFAQAFYGRPDAAAACLVLQDQHDADVTLLLFLLALAERGQTLSAEEIARLNAANQQWRAATIAPLRAMRRHLKSPPHGFEAGTLRQMIEDAEIEAERLQLIHFGSLTTVTSSSRPVKNAARASLNAYAETAGLPAAVLLPLLALFTANHEDKRTQHATITHRNKKLCQITKTSKKRKS